MSYRRAAQYIRCVFGLVWATLNRKYWLSCAILHIRKSHLIRATAVMPSSAAFHNGKPCDVKSESNNDIKMTRIYIISHINRHRHHQFLSIYIIMIITIIASPPHQDHILVIMTAQRYTGTTTLHVTTRRLRGWLWLGSVARLSSIIMMAHSNHPSPLHHHYNHLRCPIPMIAH